MADFTMRRMSGTLAVAGVAVLVMAAGSPVSLQAQQQLQFYLSFVDTAGTPVTDITADELQILEDGVEGSVTRFERIDWPVRVQVLVDNGVGMGRDNLLHIRNGVRGLLDALPTGVEASLLTTAPQPRTIVRTTSDRLALRQGVDRISPDAGASRFVDALIEAGNRIERERREREAGSDHFPVVVIVGSTGPEGSALRERDVERLMPRLRQTASTVHVVMVSTDARSITEVSGARQTVVGSAVAEVTGGRYEAIAAPSRLASLLPEIGEQIARSHERQSQQYRVIFQRPRGASGDPGHIELGAAIDGVTVRGSFDGRMP